MSKLNANWPVLKSYDQQHLAKIALPLGGIGTGTVSLGGRGDLRDWEIVNHPAKGWNPAPRGSVGAFFALWTQDAQGRCQTRALEGPIDENDYEGSLGCSVTNHSLPRFRECSFAAAYPLGQVLLSDKDMPLSVRIEAFNPMMAGDADVSGIPVAILRYVLVNKTSKSVKASVCGTIMNFIGADGSPSGVVAWDGSPNFVAQMKDNVNEFRSQSPVQGLFMYSRGVSPQAEQFGTMALTTTARAGVSHREAWADLSWGDSLLDYWDDFSADGRLEPRERGKVANPKGSLAVSVTVPPKSEKSVTFLFTWRFPNRMTWTPAKPAYNAAPAAAGGCGCGEGSQCASPDLVGNYYATCYRDAWDVAVRTAADLARLEKRTVAFVDAFCRGELPAVAKEAALFNLANLRSQTCFRTADGRFYGWEGCHDRQGCCHGSCTHVWNYEQATAMLFGDLSRSMREVEFLHATNEQGLMSFRVHLPLARAAEWAKGAADGQMGCLMKLYRDWQLCGDDAWLRSVWPGAKKALEFCWVKGGWDADGDGVMEGCQHNTMDVEYYGPNPQMEAWYLGALRAGEEMAAHLGDAEFADRCHELFEQGKAWTDAHLFNGQYYEHEIRPIADPSTIAPGLLASAVVPDPKEPNFQLGAGCLVDQLVGQFVSHVCGLGHLLDAGHVRKTLASIMKYNFREEFFGHFNHLRSFVLNDEKALIMATYPLGRRPRIPFPYFNEVMTGFEYAAAIGMLYEGMTAEGLKCIAAIRDRYDGRKRSPFNEAECGHHYGRAMTSWAALLAMTGFYYSGVRKAMTFGPLAKGKKASTVFWSNGYAWGMATQRRTPAGISVELEVLHGKLTLASLELSGVGEARFKPKTIAAGKKASFLVAAGKVKGGKVTAGK